MSGRAISVAVTVQRAVNSNRSVPAQVFVFADIGERGENMKGLNRPALGDEELEAVSGGKTGEIKVVINSKPVRKAAAARGTKLFGVGNAPQEQLMKIACPECGEVIEVNILTATSATCSNPGCGVTFRIDG